MSVRFMLAALPLVVAVVGCNSKSEIPMASPPKTTAPTITLTKDAIARLEKADAVDGKTDHVIGKCYVCGLGMDGSEKFTVDVAGYKAHLCSKGCQNEFESSAETIVLETEIPAEEKK